MPKGAVTPASIPSRSVRFGRKPFGPPNARNWPVRALRGRYRRPSARHDPKATVANGSSTDGISTSGPMGRMTVMDATIASTPSAPL